MKKLIKKINLMIMSLSILLILECVVPFIINPKALNAQEIKPIVNPQDQRSSISLSFAAQDISSALAEKLVQLSREGGLDVIDLTMNLDGALNALSDGVVDGAFWVHHLPLAQIKQIYPNLEHHEIAFSFVNFVSKNNAIAREIDLETLAELIEGKRENWIDGRPFILYLRPLVDAFEMAMRELDPRIDQAFEQARKMGKWKLIENEEMLRNQLKQQQYASTLYDTAHLKLFALPVWQMQLSTQQAQVKNQLPKVYYYFSYTKQQNFKDQVQAKDFQRWLAFITGPDYSMIQDFGWLIRGKDQ
jgi:hypothetical protein